MSESIPGDGKSRKFVNNNGNAEDKEASQSQKHECCLPRKSLVFGSAHLESLSYHKQNEKPVSSESNADNEENWCQRVHQRILRKFEHVS